MNNLARIIGPAPSDLSDAALTARLVTERNRVRDAIERFKAAPVKAAAKTSTKKLVKDSGLTYEEIMEAIQEAKANAQK